MSMTIEEEKIFKALIENPNNSDVKEYFKNNNTMKQFRNKSRLIEMHPSSPHEVDDYGYTRALTTV